MAEHDARKQLLDFLNEKAFDPVLRADADRLDSDSERERLRSVQDATRREIDRFRGRDSVSGIVDEFKGDMSSDPADEVTHRLHSLDLPALQDLEDDFRRKVEELGFDY